MPTELTIALETKSECARYCKKHVDNPIMRLLIFSETITEKFPDMPIASNANAGNYEIADFRFT